MGVRERPEVGHMCQVAQAWSPGGDHQPPDGQEAIRALSWSTVDEITNQFIALNPYAQSASILETEKENFDHDTGQQRQIECFSIATKRYALLNRATDGRPRLLGRAGKLKRSEHGLGHLLSPHTPDPERRDSVWLDEWWQHLLDVELGYETPEPAWFDRAAVGRTAVGSPRELKAFAAYNKDRTYLEQVKPWGFLAMAHPHAHERARSGGSRCLIAPFERDPDRRAKMLWIDRDRPGQPGRLIRTDEVHEIRENSIAVLSYGDYFAQYRQHPEAKATDPADSKPCHTWTRGLLQPQHARATVLLRVGKESNRLADADQPADDPEEQVIEYRP
jgi:hypothetical protein